jgi:sortase A
MIAMDRNKMTAVGTGLIAGGLFLLVVSALLVGYNLWEDHRASAFCEEVLGQLPIVSAVEQDPQTDEAEAAPASSGVPLYALYPDMEMPTVELDEHLYIGRLDIPALGLSLPVMNEWSYPNLKLAPCRYTGSAYQGNLIIAAHNYTSHFGTLRNLSCGDKVFFTDMDGNVFSYEVAEIEQLLPTDIAKMTDAGWALTLFTCTIGGSYRVTVRCVSA